MHGKKFAPLKLKTKIAKRKAGYEKPVHALFATGMMRNLLPISGARAATPKRQRSTVVVAKQRRAIGNIHSRGDMGNNLPARQWFGISDRAEKMIIKMLRKRLENILRK